MLGKLRQVQEVAVDLEHHRHRSFSGFVCLMQVSTRRDDFIVDTLTLREELEELNEVFTNPGVLKVVLLPDIEPVIDFVPRFSTEQRVTLYGSKRTLGYMSLVSSTHITHRRCSASASRMLLPDPETHIASELPRHGLATLLEMYCDFTADKRYQQADWRIRFVLFTQLPWNPS